MSQSPIHSHSVRDALDRCVPRVMTGLVALIVLARLWLVFHRLYDPDELQHLHAGYCVWKGMVPYRDFFEQHEPVLWYLSVPLFQIWGESLNVLFAGRVLIWAVGALTFFLTWVLGNRMYGPWAGSIAALLLAMHPPYQEKNVEWRPDNLAVPLVLVALICFHRTFGRRGRWWSALIGALLAASFFCTQKTAYVSAGIVAAFAFSLWVEARRARAIETSEANALRGDALQRMCAMVAGAGLVGALVFAWFATQGALDDFFQMTILLPLQWKTKERMLRYLVANLALGSVLWSGAVGGLVLALSNAGRSEALRAGVLAVAAGAVTHGLGLLSVPAAFHQYYLPLAPLAALLAGRGLAGLADCVRGGVGRERSSRGLVVLALTTALLVTGMALLLRSRNTALAPASLVVMLALLVGSMVAWSAGLRRLGVVLVMSMAAVGTAEHHRFQFQWNHAPQTQRIEYLVQATDSEDRFFDGFTGFGALRPHAFFCYWINDHSWPMIPPSQRHAGVMDALANPRTRVVLFDQFLSKHLPIEAKQYIAQNFEPDLRYRGAPEVLILVRRGRELSPRPPSISP